MSASLKIFFSSNRDIDKAFKQAINEAGDLSDNENTNFKWGKTVTATGESEAAAASGAETQLDDHVSCHRYHQPIFRHLLERQFTDTSSIRPRNLFDVLKGSVTKAPLT